MLIGAAFVAVAALLVLGVRANRAQDRIEQALEAQTSATQSLTAIIEGELSGMTPDFQETIQCNGNPLVISTTCGQGTDPDGSPVLPGETFSECLARHRRRVAAAEEACRG